MKIVPSVYHGGGKGGDFSWMIVQPSYAKALFIFNDNEQQFLDHQQDPTSASGCAAGGGNAVIRPYQCQQPPKAAGIPTGSHGQGYPSLTPQVKTVIDQAVAAIRQVLDDGDYDTLVYSSDGQGGLGTNIFRVGQDVQSYIIGEINRLATGSGAEAA